GKPEPTHQMEIIHYKNPDDDIEKCLKNILNDKGINKKKILQSKFLNNVANWNFIKQNKMFLDFYETYKRNTDDIYIYYDHVWANQNLKSKFYFDRGLKYPKNKIQKISQADENFYYIAENNKNGFRSFANDKIISGNLLDFPFGSQGEIVYKQKYKVLWSYINYDRFRYTDDKIVIDYNSVLISSDNKKEILYLLALLNSNISIKIFDCLLRNENEKDILIGIKTIKQFIRVPKITEDNQFIKDEIIKRTEEMLVLEEIKLSNLVDFSKMMMQKFDYVSVDGESLVLEKDDKEIKLKIKSGAKIARQAIEEKFETAERLKLKEKLTINLSELKSLAVIDFEKQKLLKDYIDDLVFALYFNARISDIGFDKAESIKSLCEKNKFYETVKSKH
ncbi:MAG: hypothetical protein WA063_01370, partial [Minisyncoccia bacterium]